MESIGQRIKKVRQNKGISQAYICAKLGKSPGWLSNIEIGRRSINTQKLERLAVVLGVDPASFYERITHNNEEGESEPQTIEVETDHETIIKLILKRS